MISEESPKLVSPRGSAGASQRQPSVEDWHRDELEKLRAEVAERDEALAAMHDLLNAMQPVPPEPAGPRERYELNAYQPGSESVSLETGTPRVSTPAPPSGQRPIQPPPVDRPRFSLDAPCARFTGPRGFSPQRRFIPPPGSLPENEHPQHRERFQPRSLKPLTGEEVRANRIKLLPEKIAPWWQMLEAFLIARVPELRTVLSDDDAAWEHEYKLWPSMIAVNEWLATQLYTILRAEASIVNQNFLAEVRSSNSGALSDGRRLAKLIQDERHRIPPGLELQTQEQFDALCAKSFILRSLCSTPP